MRKATLSDPRYASDAGLPASFQAYRESSFRVWPGPKRAVRPAADEGVGGGPLPGVLSHPPYTDMAGWMLTATAVPAGAAAVVRARAGPTTRAPVVPMTRMAGARMVRRIRMTASMRQPRWKACELVLAATPGRFPCRSLPAFG